MANTGATVRHGPRLGTDGASHRLDYVACWFNKATAYAADNRDIEIALVATNSITQGEQCGILWPTVFARDLSIRFAHRTFQWNTEARGSAAVHCVIVGLTFARECRRRLYDYDSPRSEPHVSEVGSINGYLIDGPQYTVSARTRPPEGRLAMHKGSQPTDGARLRKPGGGYLKFSNLILQDSDREQLLSADPNCEKWLRPYVGGEEMISGQWRWCLWLKDADPSELKASRPIVERLERVRAGRLQSPTASVRELANYPTLFTQDRQPDTDYLAIPEVSSETREYIPIAILPPSVIASSKLQIIPGAPPALLRRSHIGYAHVMDANSRRAARKPLQLLAIGLQLVPLAEDERQPVQTDRGAISSRSRYARHVSGFTA